MLIVAPLAITWVAAAALALLDGRRRWVGWLAAAALAAATVSLAVLTVTVVDGDEVEQVVAGGWPAGVGIVLRADALGVVFALLSLVVVLFALVHEVVAGVRTRGFPALMLFMATGLTGLFLTGDVFNFYVFFELAMISGYVLSAYGGETRHYGAAFIFAVVNLLGSFVFLIAVAAIYHVTGTLEMAVVGERMTEVDPSAAIMIAVGIFVAFGVKLGLFPFHFWLPAVYVGASPAVAAVLSGALANIGAYGLLRFGGELLSQELALGATVLIVIGSASVVYGAVQALSRRDAGEVLAYSAIGQAGYVLIALGVGGPVGYAAAVVYAIVNSLNKALLFLAAPLRGWLVGAAFVVGAFSVAGLPPTGGFLGKLELFRAGIDAGSVALVGLLFVGGALSFVYMFQIYQYRYWRNERLSDPSPALLRAVALTLAAVVVVLGVWPEPLLLAGREAAQNLGAGQ
ncbi:MAG: oxidoreductase [Solirubrobacterales bacterium]|nr:oxidoreductase [Solirubrobacterales bacterium]